MNKASILTEPAPPAHPNEEQFCRDVIEGLDSSPKTMYSKYFYDEKGDQLFQQIMDMPEYYLTRAELDIFRNQTVELAFAIQTDKTPFDLIELGAGDASKSKFLLGHLIEQGVDFTYCPIDISGHILRELEESLSKDMPTLDIRILEGEYFDMLQKATAYSDRRKVVLFLGGNIGNMELDQAYSFCRELRSRLNLGDTVLMGFDLKKNPHQILAAYNDSQGITASFNLNLLERINRELDANLEIKNFSHYQNYDPLTGACRSYLVSLVNQEALICGQRFYFSKHELIHMEVSQKFSEEQIEDLAQRSGFSHQQYHYDKNNWFTDAIWIAE